VEENSEKDICLLSILHKHSECLTRDALENFGDFKVSGQVLLTVKYADDQGATSQGRNCVTWDVDRLV